MGRSGDGKRNILLAWPYGHAIKKLRLSFVMSFHSYAYCTKAVHGSLILLIFREFSKIFLASAQFRFWLRRHQVSDACKYTNQNIKMSCQSNKLHSHCLATSLHSSSFDCNYILNWKANQVNTSLPSLLKHGWKRHQTHSGPIYTPSDFF